MDPVATYQDVGEKLTRALVTGNFDAYYGVFDLPVRVAPRNADAYTLTTRDELKADFDLYYSSLKVQRVTDLFRDNIRAEFRKDGTLYAEFRLHILAGAKLLVEPFETAQILNKTAEGAWKIREILSPLGHINWTLGRSDIVSGKFTNPDDPDDT